MKKNIAISLLGLTAATALVYAAGTAPVITTQPQSQTVDEGESVTFSVIAESGNVGFPEGENFTTPISSTVNLSMIWIKPGTFTMGSPGSELGRDSNEIRHQVTLTQGYWIGKYEVTQAQYAAVTGMYPSDKEDNGNYYGIGDQYPVFNVSWADAKAFCAKLTEQEKAAGRLPAGYRYTLPTEAQWEYACRAGTTTALNSGKNLSAKYECPEVDEVGWYKYNGDETSHPVGQKQPNAWGLYDMHGNVAEWCLDWYGDYPTEAVTDPVGPGTGNYRVYRGASYSSTGSWCRSAYRLCVFPTSSYNNLGFRVVLSESKVGEVGENFTTPISDSVNLDMIWINPGTFTMGSPEDELGRSTLEVQHQVTLTKGYWLGKYEVTQAQYEIIMGENPSNKPDGNGIYHDDRIGDDYPVFYVDWNMAMDFCAKLTVQEQAAGRLPEGYEYTLPTEAQWEYACRAGTTTALNNGKDLTSEDGSCSNLNEVGWYLFNSGREYYGSGVFDYTGEANPFPVGLKKPNAWGFYDMHGNVKEWCLDWFNYYPTEAVTDPVQTVPYVSYGQSWRIARGGCYYQPPSFCRSAYRSYETPSVTNLQLISSYGFRVALAPVK